MPHPKQRRVMAGKGRNRHDGFVVGNKKKRRKWKGKGRSQKEVCLVSHLGVLGEEVSDGLLLASPSLVLYNGLATETLSSIEVGFGEEEMPCDEVEVEDLLSILLLLPTFLEGGCSCAHLARTASEENWCGLGAGAADELCGA